MSDCSQGNGLYPSDCQILEGYRNRSQKNMDIEIPETMKVVFSRAEKVKLLLLDVDGVLSDGKLYYSASGDEYKCFNTQDGFGLRLLQEADVHTGVITARKSEIVQRRAEELKMQHIHQGARNKLQAFKEIMQKTGLKPVEIAYMGDDWLDLVLLERVGFASCPANAVTEVKKGVHFVTGNAGGEGAVREVCEIILQAKGVYSTLLQNY